MAYGLSIETFMFMALLPSFVVITINDLTYKKPIQNLVIWIFTITSFMFAVSFIVLRVDFVNLIFTAFSFGVVGSVAVLIGSILYKSSFQIMHVILFIMCGFWLGSNAVFMFFVLVIILFGLMRFFSKIDGFIGSGISSSFLVIVIMAAIKEIYMFLGNTYF